MVAMKPGAYATWTRHNTHNYVLSEPGRTPRPNHRVVRKRCSLNESRNIKTNQFLVYTMIASDLAFTSSLLSSTVLSTTVFGEMLIFSAVVMPGLATLDDASFLRAFQVIDRVIQQNQPVFVFVWLGSILSVLATTVFAISTKLSGRSLTLVVAAATCYSIGQVTTFAVNVPRNNRVQALAIDSMSPSAIQAERLYFESTWDRMNTFRTVLFGGASVLLSLALLFEKSPGKRSNYEVLSV